MDTFFLVIADDHVDMTKLLQYALKTTYGHTVRSLWALTVPELKEQLAVGQPLPDLLLLDYHLKPVPYCAPDVLVWIGQQPHLDSLRVDVWSSLATESQRQTCLDLGAQRFHPKSKAFADLVGFARELVEK